MGLFLYFSVEVKTSHGGQLDRRLKFQAVLIETAVQISFDLLEVVEQTISLANSYCKIYGTNFLTCG